MVLETKNFAERKAGGVDVSSNCRSGYLQSTHVSATTSSNIHEYCNLKNNVTYVKSHNGVYHIRSVFHSHKNAAKLAGNSVAILWDYFQGGCMLTKIMKTSKIERLRVYYSYG